MKKILYGVCGIGGGHTHRQLPLLEDLAKRHQIIIFAYGESLRYYTNHFSEHENIAICEVSVTFYVGTKDGIDFEATKQLPENQKDHDAINQIAKQYVADTFGTPDLVISDYEPISAEVAYAHDVPLITIDQQSKYLHGDFPEELNGCGYKDEVERLQLFFPKADTRIACSFFNVEPKVDGVEVMLLPPILRESVQTLSNGGRDSQEILLYLSAQQEFSQPYEEIEAICAEFTDFTFHIFTPSLPTAGTAKNVISYQHGDKQFLNILSNCEGIISTAGHTLLSEAMYLHIPVYALPLHLYEQQMNAYVIANSEFGVASEKLECTTLHTFLQNLAEYRENIAQDQTFLLKGDGTEKILEYIEQKLSGT